MHPHLFSVCLFGVTRPFPSYGAMLVLAMATALLVARARARAGGLDPFDVVGAGMLCVCAGLVGAWALFQAVHIDALLADPAQAVRAPGLVFYGGFAAAAATAWGYCRAYRVSLPALADVVAPGLALGHAVGRVGCFLAGCCYGRPTSSPLGMRFPPPFGTVTAVGRLAGPIHPVQLYEAAGLALLGALLVAATRALARRGRGLLFVGYLGGYALLRLVTESFRGDDEARGEVATAFGSVSTSQAIAAAMLVAAALLGARAVGRRAAVTA